MKKLVSIVLTAAMSLSLAACGSSDDSNPSANNGNADNQTWEVSASTPQTISTPLGQSLTWFAEQVNERTDGRVTINPFHSSALGAQRDIFMMMSNNEVEIAVDGLVPIDLYATDYSFFSAPFLIRSEDHLRALLDSEVFDGLSAKLKENNINMAAACVRGTRHLLSTTPINSLDELNELTIRLPDVATYVEAWSGLGASCQVMGGGEVYSGLSTGVINACEAPFDQMESDKYYEVAKHIYTTSHIVEPGAIFICDDWLNSLPEDIRQIILDTADEAMAMADELATEQTEKSLAIMEEAGVELHEIDTAPAYEKLESIWRAKFDNGDWASSYDEIMSYAE